MDEQQEPAGEGSSVDDVPEGSQSTDNPTSDQSKWNKVHDATKSENVASDSLKCSDSEDHQMGSEEKAGSSVQTANSNQDGTQKTSPEQMQVSDDPEKLQKVLKDLQAVMSDLFKYPVQADLLKSWLHEEGISAEVLLHSLQKCTALHEKHGCKNSDRPVASNHQAKSSSSSASMNPLSTTVKVFSVVTGRTCGAHDVILENVSKSTAVEITEDWQDCDVIMIFCPIASRVGSDVEAAMRDIPGDKPAILVLMHHTRDVDYSTDKKRWSEKYPNIKLEVHVLFHETQLGLLKCERNNQAAHKIQKVLKSYSKYNIRRWTQR